MKQKTLIHSSILAAIIIAAVLTVGIINSVPETPAFITVDPVSDKNIGESFTITGTTNLHEESEILVEIHPTSLDPATGMVTDPLTGEKKMVDESMAVTGTLTVKKGTQDVNTWSFDVAPTLTWNGEYTIWAVRYDKNSRAIPGEVYGEEKFVLKTGVAPDSSGKYITIDPLPETTTGSLLIVSGTTNLEEGTTLIVTADSTGNTRVRAGPGGFNLFSMPVDTSRMKPGMKTVTVYNILGELEKDGFTPGPVKATATVSVTGTFLAAETKVQPVVTGDDYISIDPIGERSVSDPFLITGTTSLPAGTVILWQIMPDTGIPPVDLNKTALGVGGNNMVIRGDGPVNRISFPVDMASQTPGRWVVLTGVMDDNEFDFTGNLRGTAYFTLN